MNKLGVAWRWQVIVSIASSLIILSSSLSWKSVRATSLEQATPDSFKLPFPGGDEAWDVINGYGQGGHGPIIADELYGLDIGKSGSDQAAGKVVVAPVGLTVLSTAHGFSCSSIGSQGVGVFARMDGRLTNHYLKICHFDKAPVAQHYKQGEPFLVDSKERAITFQNGKASHIHLSLFSSDDKNLAASTRHPIPFDNEHGYPLEGLSLRPGETHQCVRDKKGNAVSGVCDLPSTQPRLGSVTTEPSSMLLTELPEYPVLKPNQFTSIRFTVQNTDKSEWPNGSIALVHVDGQRLDLRWNQPPSIPSGGLLQWRLTLLAPPNPGVYDSVWKIAFYSKPFGEPIHIIVIVVPEGSDASFAQKLQAMIDDARQKLKENFDATREDLKRQLEERIKEELQRLAAEQLKKCSTTPAALILAGSIVWWRRKRHGKRP